VPEPIPELVSEAAPAPASESVLAELATSEPAPGSVLNLVTTTELMASASPVTDESTAPELEDTLESLGARVLQLADGLLNSRFELAIGLSEQIGSLVSEMLQWVNGLLGGLLGGGEAPGGKAPSPVNAPSTPTVPAPPPAPPVASSTGNSLSESKDSDSTILLSLGVLVSFSILLLDGRFSWLSRDFLKPSSALRLATERPG